MAVLRLRSATTYETGLREHTTNDNIEKDIAIYDVLNRLFCDIPVENLSGIAQQKTAHDFFEMAPIVAHDWRSHSCSKWPLLSSLNERLPQSLVTMARHHAEEAQRHGWQALKEQDEERPTRRDVRAVELLDNTVHDFVYAMELFVQWTHQRSTTGGLIRNDERGILLGFYLVTTVLYDIKQG